MEYAGGLLWGERNRQSSYICAVPHPHESEVTGTLGNPYCNILVDNREICQEYIPGASRGTGLNKELMPRVEVVVR